MYGNPQTGTFINREDQDEILIIQLLQGPAEPGSGHFSRGMYWVAYYFSRIFMVSDQSYLCIIFSLGQANFSLDRYVMSIYLSLDKYPIILVPYNCH